jgi:hypothetical protein
MQILCSIIFIYMEEKAHNILHKMNVLTHIVICDHNMDVTNMLLRF